MKLTALEYALPKELIAQKPVKPRDHNRLLVLNRSTGKITHQKFYNIINYLDAGDILVLNNTRVVPSRLIAERETGGKIDPVRSPQWGSPLGGLTSNGVEILLCQQNNEDKTIWRALLNNSHLKEEETLWIKIPNPKSQIPTLSACSSGTADRSEQGILLTLLKKEKEGWLIRTEPTIDINTLQKIGKMPLPP
ncbi:MAG: S-adenosylmethionine:tRNA ribosyltransferase-isomerase, partial [Planctomycetota bacterium]|nr:S-adenosylmethionine:tRNA ribosyltransferase-isomerase [Planctomycetota bacterium]